MIHYNIQVDARGCGEGKTTLGIYPRIQELVRNGERVLIVVPSIKLQEQYQRNLKLQHHIDVKVINSQGRNAEDYSSTGKQLGSAMINLDNQVICITSETFKRVEIPQFNRQHWHLIVDEAFPVVRSIVYERKNSDFNWAQFMTSEGFPVGPYWNIVVDESRLDNWSRSSDQIQQLIDPHWSNWATMEVFQELLNESTERQRWEIIQEMRPDIFVDWSSVHIAAAAFEHHHMSRWFKRHGIYYTTQTPFEPRELPIIIHTINDLNWSKYKARGGKYDGVLDQYQDYVQETCDQLGLKLLTLRNNDNLRKFNEETRINHNPHGINEYTSYRAISLESAINPSEEYQRFMTEVLGMEEISGRRQITTDFSAYLFYQCVMRTAARLPDNDQTVHVFGLDEKTLVALTNFFIPKDATNIATDYVGKQPLTRAEMNKRYYEKRKEQQKRERLEKLLGQIKI